MTDLDEARRKLQAIRVALKGFFKQRDAVVDGILVALLSRQHILLIGPPGTGKTLLALAAARCVRGARFEYVPLHKLMTIREVFVRQTSILETPEAEGRRIDFKNHASQILLAHLVVLDEVFKAAVGPLLNGMLQWLNERVFSVNAGEVKSSPLVTACGCSNEFPGENDGLAAFADRFLFRFWVDYLTASHGQETAFIEMMLSDELPAMPAISFDELIALQRRAAAMPISQKHIWIINSIRQRLTEQHGIQPSDRRFKEALKAASGFALMNGREKVEFNDLMILQHILPMRDRSEERVVREVVLDSVGEHDLLWAYHRFEEAEAVRDGAVELLRSWHSILPVDDEARKRKVASLGEADGKARRLDEIHASLDRLYDVKAASSIATTLRTLANQVNVFRAQLVRMREVEDPFVSQVPT